MNADDANPLAAAGLGRGFRPGSPSLVVYLMAGYPTRKASLSAMRVVAEAGADLIELGVPYADPMADGPVIADAAKYAREAAAPEGFGLEETLDLAAEFSLASMGGGVSEDVLVLPRRLPPVAVMTYLNPMLRLGLAKTASIAADAGVSGFIVPDLLPDTPFARDWLEAAETFGLDTVFLVAPTSTPDRIRAAVEGSSGFVYVVSSLGVTGERTRLSAELPALLARVREYTRMPAAVGFGVSTPEQAAGVAELADGVVVGSAIVRRQDDPAELAAFVRSLKAALTRG